MDEFNYKAPQFVDLSSPTASGLMQYGDDFFDVHQDTEIGYSEVVIKNGTVSSISEVEILENTQINSTIEEENEEVQDQNESAFCKFRQAIFNDTVSSPEVNNTPVKIRRSMSVGAIQPIPHEEEYDIEESICSAIENLEVSMKKTQRVFSQSILEGIKSSYSTEKLKCRPQSAQRARSVSRDALNHVGGKLKRKGLQEELQPRKYISLAEAVRKFQTGTPVRFHSKSKNDTTVVPGKTNKLPTTKPRSPALATKARARSINYVSHAEQLEREADEMKKRQLKANPLNPNILRTPVYHQKIEKKAPTKPEPFHFAEIKYKPVSAPKEEPYHFHARPVPKTTSVPEIQPHVRYSTFSRQSTPTLLKPKPKLSTVTENTEKKGTEADENYSGVRKQTPQKLKNTVITPFSFEDRDKELRQRKEEKIKKFLEEQTKGHVFHARPISAAISKSSQVESKVVKMITDGTLPAKKDENAEPERVCPKPFKARPASVIHKKAFQPKREPRPLIEVSEFTLNTERRADERQNFEKKLKEKEEDLEKYRKMLEENLKRKEMEEIARLRKETVHRANPVKAFKEFKLKPCTKDVTSPQSPNFSKLRGHSKYEYH